jgi:hypothetical protein
VITAVLAVATVLAGGTAACGGDGSSELPPPASSPSGGASQLPGLDLSPAEQEAVDEARAKFDEFMNAYIDVSTAELPTAEEAEGLFARVEQQAAGLLPQELRTEIVGRWGENRIISGSIKWSFVDVSEVDLDREVNGKRFPRVTLKYCIDAIDWLTVDADTGERAAGPGSHVQWIIAADWSDDWGGLGHNAT